MVIGVPKEVKDQEFRVALTPSAVQHLVSLGHSVRIEKEAGEGSGFSDDEYHTAGAIIVETHREVFRQAELILKVKEPQPQEYQYIQSHHTVFTYLHLAASKSLTEALMASGCTAIAYETTETVQRELSMLRPMSEIAGRMSIQIGAHFLERHEGGRGVLLGGIPGVSPGHVVIIGSGVVGASATKMAVGMGARVTVLSIDVGQLRHLDDLYAGRVTTLVSRSQVLDDSVKDADLVIGAVMIPGAKAPKLISRDLIRYMKRGAVFVDVAVDQGGCAETTHPTTHSDPVYVVDHVLHYAVTNIPGIVPRTSTMALTNATLPFIVRLVNQGVEEALKTEAGLARGVNVSRGRVTCRAVAEAHGLPYTPFDAQ
ncbi:MAG: alanine dehydrogenase [Nitrospirales bacterium]|nr:MAG: alanine dehydrogenase [Nitrospirales bacterium]